MSILSSVPLASTVKHVAAGIFPLVAGMTGKPPPTLHTSAVPSSGRSIHWLWAMVPSLAIVIMSPFIAPLASLG